MLKQSWDFLTSSTSPHFEILLFFLFFKIPPPPLCASGHLQQVQPTQFQILELHRLEQI
jgi:hypothetical protein